MPVHLVQHSRRQFLKTVGAGIVVCSSPSFANARPAVDGDLVYLLNDTHIGEKQPSDSPVPSHLRQVVTELVDRKTQPSCVLINGDLALKDGQPGDYQHFAKLLRPLHEAQIETHLTLGNHDNREAFYSILEDERPADPPVESRHISVVQTPKANFFLLDSLKETMITQGAIGGDQLSWLAQALDAHATKPALIVAHHNPRLGGDPLHFPGGLIDSQPLWNILSARSHVKAYIHGHIHDRSIFKHQGIHILNTPATSYVGNPATSTTGWTTARLSNEGVTLTTHTTDPQHSWNGETKILQWRG
ncbi:metallophosphoesterase family protein [Rubinisphaera italica]|uniref:3',5'-cyclic adenosine monophosphate phosphodiesterase CpdA n=1 Tax=Rubinisphaera italica TaxID=2527969 RepID=A0A5C5XC81_9PLAN|nr:metallophosphoesterase [Rubinisphaera italica]TWT60620.1 3',5'-cyclic adenosine monophosphate phosphodiesterase CpdA [Rubinisphaera italica]